MKKSPFLLLLAGLAASPAVAASPDYKADLARIDAVLDKNYPQLDALYKDIHAHPEVAFQETRTAALLAAKMRKLGFEVTEKVGGTGIVAIYRNGDGPTVLVRTELDGLPMLEKTGLPYQSRYTQKVNGEVVPTAHACGHDIHMTWWVATAEALLAMKDRWHGTLMFVGQPAEETVSGAKAMLDDELFKRFPKPDYGFAAHVAPDALGNVHFKEGMSSSASDQVRITFNGKGAHGSMPASSIDPIVMGGHFVSDVQTIRSREVDPSKFGVITVGSFHAGTAPNIIPDSSVLELTLRSHDPEIRKQLMAGVTKTAEAVSAMAGAPDPTIDYLYGTAAVYNDPKLTDKVAAVVKDAVGGNVSVAPESMAAGSGSEDFSEFIAAGVPSVFIGVGGVKPEVLAGYVKNGERPPVNHSPFFAPDPEGSIRKGTQTLALAVLSVAGSE
ncbi:amidohydrolase [Novosphingobium pentaromativorans]|uniref:Hippurate hydrolase n=1 Tax=Novosphingobium pentaromativorans US6-1 TaxID=1088721 RepID=G6EG14_9SPHN|nr:amidohydrolase [Novosphingobium pentaromativorans]AIT82288.1 peptidase M20 [Novosphingobium pentaromativorans US6-1]EHJ59703.1 hippurate hydrolase [Novosphingobium pentaromativorans US6-1]